MAQHPDEAKLKDLWSRRDRLSEQEWEHLYRLVSRVLQARLPAELDGLPGSADRAEKNREYLVSFFVDKVFQPTAASALFHVGALHEFYRRYLTDHLRRQMPVEAVADEDEEDGPLARVAAEIGLDEREARLLHDAGLKPESVEESARAFLSELESWARRYLDSHLCPDREDSVPLVHLARRHRIPSYHYKARQLGINSDSPESFRKSRLGAWLSALGVPIDAESRELIEILLKILCQQALMLAEGLARS